MKALHFTTENANLGPPPGDDGRNVADLPARQVLIPWLAEDGSPARAPAFVSFWRPSARELACLNAGRPIGLMVVGGHPPVTVFVDQEGELSGELGAEGVETAEYPVAYPWPQADQAWRDHLTAKATARKIMEAALQGAAEQEGE